MKGCGKSTLLSVLQATCRRPLKSDNISASAVFRVVEALREDGGVSLLVDEMDTFLPENEQLRGILNSGFEASGQAVRVEEKNGERHPVSFATFCPAAMAGIGKKPATIADRSVPVVLRRKTTAEKVTKLRDPGTREMLAVIAQKLARWTSDFGEELPLNPPVPDAMSDWEGDISIPLLSIADHAQADWPNRARHALLEVFGRPTEGGGHV